MKMSPTKKEKLLAEGCSDPPGPGGEGGIVSAPPPSSLDDGPPPVSRVGTGKEMATAQEEDRQEDVWSEIPELLQDLRRKTETANAWIEYLEEWEEDGDVEHLLKELPSMLKFMKRERDVIIDTRITLNDFLKIRRERRNVGVGTPRKERGVGPCLSPRAVRGTSPSPDGEKEKEKEKKSWPVYLPVRGACGPPNAGGGGDEQGTGAVCSSHLSTSAGEVFPSARRKEQGQEGPSTTSLEKRMETSSTGSSSSGVSPKGRITYSEALRRGRMEFSDSGKGGGRRDSGVGEERGTRGVVLRIPGVGDTGVSGFGAGDLIVTIPSPGVGSPKEGREPKKRGNSEEKEEKHLSGEVEVVSSPLRCYRCLEVGHLAKWSRGKDRSRRCYRCNVDSCKWKNCGSP